MASDVFTAINGTATWGGATIDDVRNISATIIKAVKEYASSSTSGKVSRKFGHKDASGSFDIYIPEAETGPLAGDSVVVGTIPFQEGDRDDLVLKSSAGQTIFSGKAVIISMAPTVPIESGDNVAMTVEWGQDPTA